MATVYYVVNPTTNTFQLSATQNGPAINITDAGTGTQTFTVNGKQILVKGLQHVELGAYTSNSFSATVQVQISDQSDVVFTSAASATNRWSYVQIKDLITNTAIDGGTGITSSGTDLTKTYEVNTNGQYWISAQFTAYSAGNINLMVTAINDR